MTYNVLYLQRKYGHVLWNNTPERLASLEYSVKKVSKYCILLSRVNTYLKAKAFHITSC
jgi:hypothetical protein